MHSIQNYYYFYRLSYQHIFFIGSYFLLINYKSTPSIARIYTLQIVNKLFEVQTVSTLNETLFLFKRLFWSRQFLWSNHLDLIFPHLQTTTTFVFVLFDYFLLLFLGFKTNSVVLGSNHVANIPLNSRLLKCTPCSYVFLIFKKKYYQIKLPNELQLPYLFVLKHNIITLPALVIVKELILRSLGVFTQKPPVLFHLIPALLTKQIWQNWHRTKYSHNTPQSTEGSKQVIILGNYVYPSTPAPIVTQLWIWDKMYKTVSIESIFDYWVFFKTLLQIATPTSPELQNINSRLDILSSKNEPFVNWLITPILLRKVRFKPGYRRIWVIYRANLRKLFNWNFRYQYKLTKYIQFFKHYSYKDILYYFELQLLNILYTVQFFPLLETSSFYIKNALISVNGYPCINPSFQIKVGDVITCKVSIKYYVFYRLSLLAFWFNYFTYKNKLFKYLSQNTKQWNQQKFNKFFFYISFFQFFKATPAFIEIDFMALQFYILFLPHLESDFTVFLFLKKYAIMEIYNWKYLT